MVIDFNSIYDIPKDIDRLFEGLLRSAGGTSRRQEFPLINIGETEENYYVDIYMPGVAAEDVEITLANRSLIIKGERKAPEGRYFRQERPAGSFQRIVRLTVPVARDKVAARNANGIVRVTLPKEEETKPRRITVEA